MFFFSCFDRPNPALYKKLKSLVCLVTFVDYTHFKIFLEHPDKKTPGVGGGQNIAFSPLIIADKLNLDNDGFNKELQRQLVHWLEPCGRTPPIKRTSLMNAGCAAKSILSYLI